MPVNSTRLNSARRRRPGLWPVAALLVLALTGCDGTTATPSPSTGPATEQSSAQPSGQASGPQLPASETPPSTGSTTSAPPTSAPKPGASAQGLELVRSGGIAGTTETITVKPDGTWAKVSSRGNTVTGKGTLTAGQMAQLQKLINDPKLAAEAKRTVGNNRCADAFTYLLVVHYQLIRYTSCGQADKPEVTMAIISLLQSATKGQ